MRISIEASDLPGTTCGASADAPIGYRGIRVGVQARNNPHEILDPTPADAGRASWSLECTARTTADGVDITGPYVQGRPGGRFVYLSWLSDEGAGPLGMFRRAKLHLGTIPAALVEQAGPEGTIVGRLGLTDGKGNPLCASVRPSAIEWSVH